MLTALHPAEEDTGLLAGQAAVFHRLVDPRRGVPAADLTHDCVELARPRGAPQPLCLVPGDATALEHLVDSFEEALPAGFGLVLVVLVHNQHFM
jgi:hypothetical protein